MIDPRMAFIDALVPVKETDPCDDLRADRDRWKNLVADIIGCIDFNHGDEVVGWAPDDLTVLLKPVLGEFQ